MSNLSKIIERAKREVSRQIYRQRFEQNRRLRASYESGEKSSNKLDTGGRVG